MEYITPIDGPYITHGGKKLLDFSSHDFLGLAQNPEIKKAAIKCTLKCGVGVPVSPLGSDLQKQTEGKLAHYLGKEAALIFPTYEEVKAILKKKAGALDISYELGIVGESGFGSYKDEIVFGTLSYGVGCSGSFIAGTKKAVTGWTPSEPMSYPALGAIDSALSFIPELGPERQTVEKNKKWLAQLLKKYPAKMEKSPKAILEFDSAPEAQKTRELLQNDQIFLAPPVENTLYIAVTALHTPDDLDQLTQALKKFSATDWALLTQSLTPTP